MPKISVIIPIFNAQNYLAQCLESVLNQSYTNLEIICIDDGSSDRSASIAKAFAKRDNRIIFLAQDNAGASAARNAGLKVASGEFVLFIDSDDYIDSDYIAQLVESSIDLQSVVINFNVLFEFDNATRRFNAFKTFTGRYSLTYEIITKFDFFVCNCLLPKKIIDRFKLAFVEGKIYEDAGLLYQVLPFAKDIICIDKSAYHYRQRADSTTGNLAKQSLVSMDRIDIFSMLARFYKEHNLIEKCGLPFNILCEIHASNSNAQSFFEKAKCAVNELGITPRIFKRDKTMKLFMQLDNASDFIALRDNLQNSKKRAFRVRLFKPYSIIKIFNITLFERFRLKNGKTFRF